MNKRIIIDERWLRMAAWGGISLVVLAIAIGGTRYLVENGPEAPKEKPQVVFETVEVQPVEVVTLDLILPSQGEVVPRKRTTLTAEVRGKLTFVDPRFEAGETFEAGKEARGGDRVLEIDRSDYEAALATAEATVAEAELALVMEEVRKEQGLRDWAKLGNGREPTELVKRVPQILSAKKGVAAAVASRNKAMRDLERTEIRVPYDCRIEKTYVDEGTVVNEGMPLADIVSVGRVEVRLPLSLEDYGYLQRKDGRVVGSVVATGRIGGKEVNWEGTILRSEELVERSTRSINVVAEFAEEEGYGPPVGLFVKASISGISVPRVVKVPRAAMIDGDKVLLVREGRLEIRPVEVLRTQEDVVIVKDGIEEGELIVLTPPNAPKQGEPVNVLERKGKVPAVGSGEVQPLRASSPD